MRYLMFIAVVLVSTSLLGQDSSADNAPTKVRTCVGKNSPQPCVAPPMPITNPSPDYSPEAREKKLEGEVYLTLVAGVDGKTHDVRVTKSLGSGLDEKAVEAVKQWTFKPGTLDGRPVALQLHVSVAFHLL